jgi:hypothetical protein
MKASYRRILVTPGVKAAIILQRRCRAARGRAGARPMFQSGAEALASLARCPRRRRAAMRAAVHALACMRGAERSLADSRLNLDGS